MKKRQPFLDFQLSTVLALSLSFFIYIIEAQTLRKGEFGENCTDSSECNDREFLFCSSVDKKCICDLNKVYDQQWRRCLNLAEHDCSDNRACVQNSSCSRERICECDNEFVPTPEGYCQLKHSVPCHESSVPCSDSAGLYCPAPSDNQFAPNPSCTCKSEDEGSYGWSENAKTCAALVGTKCNSSIMCTDNAHCESGLCKCDDSHLRTYNKRCLKKKYGPNGIQLNCTATVKEYCAFFEYVTCVIKRTCDCDFPVGIWAREESAEIAEGEVEDCRRAVGEQCGLTAEAGEIFPCVANAVCVGMSYESGLGVCQCRQGMYKTKKGHCSKATSIIHNSTVFIRVIILTSLLFANQYF